MTTSMSKVAFFNADIPAKEQTTIQWFVVHALRMYRFLNRSFVYRHANGTVTVDHKNQTITF